MEAQQIEVIISEQIACSFIQIDGDGVHWHGVIVSDLFGDKSRLQRQQMVYKIVQSRMESNEIHALSFKTFTSSEWSKQNG